MRELGILDQFLGIGLSLHIRGVSYLHPIFEFEFEPFLTPIS